MSLPSHRWFHATWLSSETRYGMSAEERGIYRDALDLCYAEGSIPADEMTLQRLLAVSREEFERSWPKVSTKFEPHLTMVGRLVNPKAKGVLEEQERYRRRQSEFGKKGGRPRQEGSQKGGLSESKRVAKANPTFSEKPNSSSYEEEGTENAHHSMSGWVKLFAQWWEIYPRKTAKADAQKAYRAIVVEAKVTTQQRAGLKPFPHFADRHAELVTATKRWAELEFGKRDVDKIPYPATFLNRLDWLSAPAVKNSSPAAKTSDNPFANVVPGIKSWESVAQYHARLRELGFPTS